MAQDIKNDLLAQRWVEVSRKVVSRAQERHEDAMDRLIFEGARSIGEMLRHVAFWNLFVADILRGRPADGR